MSIPTPTTRQSRMVIVRIDDIVNILKDYVGVEDIPPTAMPIQLKVSPQHGRKLGIVLLDNNWDGDGGDQLVDFQIKRYFGVS